MKQINSTLYGKDKSGSLKLWEVWVDDNKNIVKYGKLGGKIQNKVTECFGKNIGKKNETSNEEQAVLEAEAKCRITSYNVCYTKLLRYFVDERQTLKSE